MQLYFFLISLIQPKQTIDELDQYYSTNAIQSILIEPVHDISNNVVCETSKASDQPAHMRSLIRAFASRLSILSLLSY